ncbi:MAG: hypothetical protein LIO87_04230, partial [Eubacterium sp.]|nr:hypothetical protein [Eubacterium sp.]
MTYNGDETLINDGVYLPNSMLDFWKWAYSDLIDNTYRGTFAEYIVKSALDRGGYSCNPEGHGWDQYDLDGPIIPSVNRNARIEVKVTSYVQHWEIRHPDMANFRIAKATIFDDEKFCYPPDADKIRKNDMYVFVVYTARDKRCNSLDLSWWRFYVLPTHIINAKFGDQKTVMLKTIQKLGDDVCRALTFNELCDEIVKVCNSLSPEETYPFSKDTLKWGRRGRGGGGRAGGAWGGCGG